MNTLKEIMMESVGEITFNDLVEIIKNDKDFNSDDVIDDIGGSISIDITKSKNNIMITGITTSRRERSW